ncbi:MAG: LarC family nickel insertion protein [Rubrivivax sp.]|nr:LarC family nickel insertion protein [Rubrivivax sp.]
MHIHLDPVGGIAGDMFIAALLDAYPELGAGLQATLGKAGLPPGTHCAVLEHNDGVLSGRRFDLSLPAEPNAPGAQRHPHDHVGLAAVCASIAAMGLDAAVAARAQAIFAVLAQAEAKVHGVTVDEVEFHEVGALDSIADIVGAAWIIETLQPATWSVGALPLGSGRVHTAHGALPVPAPAVVELLKGFAFFDDALPGERVTPTGAAILRHLDCTSGVGPPPGRLGASGLGFGTRKWPGTPNVLRVLAFDTTPTPTPLADEVALLAFEVDDQTAEDLSQGLERLRACRGVLDVVQSPVFGKKGRMATQVQVLAEPLRLDAVVAACFAETTTLGVRHQLVARHVLARHETIITGADGRAVRVKVARRPDGTFSAKAESDDLREAGARSAREALRRASEAAALGMQDEYGE